MVISKSMGSVAPAYLVSVFMVFVSVFLGFFSSSIFILWLSMELGVCAFCGVLSFSSAKMTGESVMKYFLVSAFSGVGLLCALFLDWAGYVNGLEIPFLELLFFMCIYAKLGLPPFHFWVVGVMSGCWWFSVFLLLTLQKALPFVFLGCSVNFGSWVLLVVTLSALSGGVAGLSHYEPFFIVGYSSMVTGNWLVLVSFFSWNVLLSSFLLYSVVVFLLFFFIREGSWMDCFGHRSIWAMMSVIYLVGMPNGPIFLMKVNIYQTLLSSSCVAGAWMVALTSIFLLPLYVRILTLSALGIWGSGLNEALMSKWPLVLVLFFFMAFCYSGVGWATLNFSV